MTQRRNEKKQNFMLPNLKQDMPKINNLKRSSVGPQITNRSISVLSDLEDKNKGKD